MPETPISFDEWVKNGLDMGFIGPPVCSTHDGLPMSEDEENEFNEGFDPCINVVRLYWDSGHKKQVEENHTPSQWRNHYG